LPDRSNVFWPVKPQEANLHLKRRHKTLPLTVSACKDLQLFLINRQTVNPTPDGWGRIRMASENVTWLTQYDLK
jgi:hypothetical protein